MTMVRQQIRRRLTNRDKIQAEKCPTYILPANLLQTLPANLLQTLPANFTQTLCITCCYVYAKISKQVNFLTQRLLNAEKFCLAFERYFPKNCIFRLFFGF